MKAGDTRSEEAWRWAPPASGDRAADPGVAAGPAGEYPPAMDYLSRITVEPDKRGGKPCIRGLRITVYDVLDYPESH